MSKKVFINGCFDVLHLGHIRLFKYAKTLGDHLVVALDTDDRVRALKGSERPFNRLEDRTEVMEALRPIDEVRSFGTDAELTALIREVAPDVMIVGSDWRGKEIIGAKYAKKVIYFDRIHEYSTTKILKDITGR